MTDAPNTTARSFDPNPPPTAHATSQERLRWLAGQWKDTIPIRCAWLLKAADEMDALQAKVKEA